MRGSREEWGKRIERWKDSGLSAKEFARETGLNPGTLTYWKYILAKEARETAAEATAGNTPRVPVAPRARATPTRSRSTRSPRRRHEAIASSLPIVELRGPGSDGRFELELGAGLRLRIPAGFESDALRRLLGVLEGRR